MSKSTVKKAMTEVITRPTHSINKISGSSSSSLLPNSTKSRLIKARNLLDERNEWTRLLYRQLTRLMDYDGSLSDKFWIELNDNIRYATEEPYREHGENNGWKSFLEQMEFERKLEQRELQFNQTFKQRKCFRELFVEHKAFFKVYLDNCISLHGKLQVQGLVENIDDLLCELDQPTKVSLTLENRKYLKENLKSVDITLDYSSRRFNKCQFQFSTSAKSGKGEDNRRRSFLPSVEETQANKPDRVENIHDILEKNRWLVILGDPGSGKTTLLRWITYIFAEAASRDDEEEVVLADNHHLPVRIPILVRIGEFAEWNNLHPTKTLMDYIGEHTWFSERYCSDDGKRVLKELIDHGHALILLDGFDEILGADQPSKIIDLVKNFMDEYARASDFISAFDNKSFSCSIPYLYRQVVEKQFSNKSGANQMVVTSRIVGYRFYSLSSPFIHHYSLLPMNNLESKEFVNGWLQHFKKGVKNVLLDKRIQFDEKTAETLLTRRCNAIKIALGNMSELIFSDPSLLSLICTSLFSSPNEFCPKLRIEVYDHTVQKALRSVISEESTMLESVPSNFLCDLATYIHLHSSSGLIDEFDIECICSSVVKKQIKFNDGTKLRDYVKNLIHSLCSNFVIWSAQGLQVFGFRHLPIQEYFVAQALIKGCDGEQIAKHILASTINFRFRESLLLAIGWISWKWSFDNYDKFCNEIITLRKGDVIPVGTLLFFDAFKDIQSLPSKTVIFKAINNVFDHPSNMITMTYLKLILPKLSNDIVVEWMESYLNDDKQLLKFCECILMKQQRYHGVFLTNQKSLPPVVYQQLWSYYYKNSFSEFIVDQTLRRALIPVVISDQIFHKDLSSYLLSYNICVSNVHPLIASVIIAVSGNISLNSDNHSFRIQFIAKQTYRESSILKAIRAYFCNKEESHPIKILTLIQTYDGILQQSLSTDTSADIVDTFIALICLQGLSQTSVYKKYDGYQALPLALDKLKRTWFYFKKSCDSNNSDSDISCIRSEIESIMNMYFSLPNQSDEQCLSFSVACESAWRKLGLWDLSNTLNIGDFHDSEIDQYFQDQPRFIHFINKRKLDQIAIINSILPRSTPFFLLTFLPESLQLLYNCTTISPTKDSGSLPQIVFLSRYLMHLEQIEKNDLNFYLVFSMLQPLFKEHHLENYALVLLAEKRFDGEDLTTDYLDFYKAMRDRQLFDKFYTVEEHMHETLINKERQRISQAKALPKNEEKALRLFAASISLARLFQSQYRYEKTSAIEQISLSAAENQEVLLVIRSIHDSILRIIALSTVLDMKDPLIWDEKQRDKLRWEVVFLLQHMLPNLPLLTSTFLFIQCYNTRQFFPLSFQYMANIIGKKLNQKLKSKEHLYQQTAYIALRQLNNVDLLHHLSKFAKQKEKLTDVFQLNSRIFYQFFNNIKEFNPSETMLLSSMYLGELSFDAQILKIYIKDNQKNNLSSFKEFQQLSNDSSKDELILTFKVAIWITNYLQKSNKEVELHQIIKALAYCSMVEQKAISVIEKWISYRTDKVLHFFAHYAALQLIIRGSNIDGLMDIINEMLLTNRKFRLKFLIQHLLSSRHIDSIAFRQIAVKLQQNIYYSRQISVKIDREQILYVILSLELERVIETMSEPPKTATNPFLSMIENCSKDLQVYLAEYLRTFINKCDKFDVLVKQKYVCIVIKWIITSSINIGKEKFSIELYEYIFTLVLNQRYPQVQKTIVNALHLVFANSCTHNNHIFLQTNSIIVLEKIICAHDKNSEQLVAACLLAYGNYLLVRKKFRIDWNLSQEMQKVLSNLERSTSELISIRATFCLFFGEHSNITLTAILKRFEQEPGNTSEKKYKVLLQQNLYMAKNRHSLLLERNGVINNDLNTQFDEYVNTFIVDLYNYLCDEDNDDYLSDPTPEYVEVALAISQRKPNEFCNAVRNSQFGEDEFKKKISSYFKSNPRHREAMVKLYTVDGMVTVGLIDMLQGLKLEDKQIYKPLNRMNHLKQVFDRSTIEHLFQTIVSESSKKKLTIYLSILKSLVRAHLISLVEMHQELLPLISASFNNDKNWQNNDKDILELLLGCSCIKNTLLSNSGETLLTKCDIDEEYARQNEYLESKLSMFSGRCSLINLLSSILINSN